jgi:hypothetical protein
MPTEPIGQADFILKIARRHGYKKLDTLWSESGLDAKRSNPNILFHGIPSQPHPTAVDKFAQADDCTIPPVDERTENKATDAHYSFKTGQDKLYLRLRVVDSDFKPFDGATYALSVDGVEIEQSKLVPDSDGVLNVEVSPTASSGKLTVKFTPQSTASSSTQPSTPQTNLPSSPSTTAPPPVEVEFWLQIGRLDPIKDISPGPDNFFTPGVQQRLNNLGFGAGSVTGVTNASTESALRRFQTRCGVTGEESGGKPIAGPQTLDWLEKLHDKPGKPPEPGSTGSSGGGSNQTASTNVTPVQTPTQPVPQTTPRTQPILTPLDPKAAAKKRYEDSVVAYQVAEMKRREAYRKKDSDFTAYSNANQTALRLKKEMDEAKRAWETA